MDFRYRARASDGKIVEGFLSGESQTQIVGVLRGRGMFPISVETRKTESSSSSGGFLDDLRKISSISLRDKVVFFRQLATMVKAGITLGNALEILVEQTKNARLADAIRKVKASIDSGFSMSAAMRSRKEFSTLMVAIVQAGEEGGVLDDSLDRLASFLERQDALRRKIVSAVSYPSVVILFSFFILYILVTVVIPKFAKVFKGLNVPLPKLTVFMFDFGMFIANYWYLPLLAVLLIVLVTILLQKSPSTRPAFDAFKLKVPITGDILYRTVMARSNRTLASLVQSGVPILKSLDMTAEVSDNYVIAQGYVTLRDAAKRGKGLGDTAKELKIFPAMIAHMMRIGEETGQLEEMLNKVADWFELELDEKIKRLTAVLEPVLIMIVGGMVAFVALAIFTPIVTAIQTLM
jgi:type IV pilus assembly protein PilC